MTEAKICTKKSESDDVINDVTHGCDNVTQQCFYFATIFQVAYFLRRASARLDMNIISVEADD